MSFPRTIWQGNFPVFGVEVRCFVLEDGVRGIETESVERLLSAPPEGSFDRQQIDALVDWLSGRGLPGPCEVRQ